MCRLLGAISSGAPEAEYLLLDASHSLLRQSRADPKRLQGDGWGIGWISRGRPKWVKSPMALYREPDKFRQTAREAKGKVLIGHVRWASNPLKLPKADLIGLKHTQPFTYRHWIFAHNGTLLIPTEVRAELGPLAKYIQGNNDSEVFFYWLLKYLLPSPYPRKAGDGMTDVIRKIHQSIDGLEKVWMACRNKYPLYKYPYHGLNWVLTNGKVLIAMCYVNRGGLGKAKALVRRSEPYYQLRYKHQKTGWIVASEPLDDDREWKSMRHGQILIADARKGRLVWF